jgi:hypothetical protein
VAKRIQAHPELAHHGAGFLLYVVLDELVDSFVPTMDQIGERVEDLGEDVFAGRQVQNDVFALRRDLVTIRRVVGPMGDAMTVLLRRELGLFDEETRRYLQDIYDHLLRVAQTVEAYQDLAAGALEANLTVVSNKVNEVARTLTAYAAIFAALTLVSGVYGMNFAYMPELGWRFGHPYALGLMLALAAGLWGYFKRKAGSRQPDAVSRFDLGRPGRPATTQSPGGRSARDEGRGRQLVVADRGLRDHRRHPGSGPGEPQRLDRLAVPAALRLRRLLRGPARRPGQRALADRPGRRGQADPASLPGR